MCAVLIVNMILKYLIDSLNVFYFLITSNSKSYFLYFYFSSRNDLINKIVIKGNTREFIEKHGIENCYSNGKQIHLDYCRDIFEATKRGNKENNQINNENVLLLDDDTQNLKLALDNGHYVFQVTSTCQLSDFFKFLKETFELNH